MEININSRSESEEAPKQSECESCKNLCVEAKEQVKVQDKKIYKMTIALAVAMTLIGQEAAEKAVSLFDSITSITDKAEGMGGTDSDSKEESDNEKPEQEPKDNSSINISIPTNAFNKSSQNTPRYGPVDTILPYPSPSTTPLTRVPYSGFTPIYSPSPTLAPVPSAIFPPANLLVPRSELPPLAEPWRSPSLPVSPKDTNVCFDIVPPPSTLATFLAGMWIIHRRA